MKLMLYEKPKPEKEGFSHQIKKFKICFNRSQECNEYFELLKRKFVEAPIIRFADWSRKFHVHVNASNIVVSSVLAQHHDDMVDHLNAYAIRKLNKLEQNYPMTEQDALAMIFALQKF